MSHLLNLNENIFIKKTELITDDDKDFYSQIIDKSLWN